LLERARIKDCRIKDYAGFAGEVRSEGKMIVVQGLPTKKHWKAQFSTVRTRNGKESIPFAGLEAGDHLITFVGKRKKVTCLVSVWYSLNGWAWQITKITKEEKINQGEK